MPTEQEEKSKPSADRAARRAADRERMRQAIEALRESEGWRRWLASRGHFRSYSLHNQLLIAHQRPGATRVAGFRAWLKLGYAVRKGERSIGIWAPAPPSAGRMRQWERAGEDPERRPRTRFRLVPVFDRSQVDPLPDFPGGPAPLEPPSEPVEGDGLAHRFAPLAAFARSLGLTVEVEPVPGSASGYLEPASDRIVIDVASERFSPNAQLQTLVHELAHALVRRDQRDDDPKLPYAEEEVVAESVAYAVCGALGLDVSGDSVPYLAGWGERAEGEPIERYAALIDRLASRLEDAALTGAATPENLAA